MEHDITNLINKYQIEITWEPLANDRNLENFKRCRAFALGSVGFWGEPEITVEKAVLSCLKKNKLL